MSHFSNILEIDLIYKQYYITNIGAMSFSLAKLIKSKIKTIKISINKLAETRKKIERV